MNRLTSLFLILTVCISCTVYKEFPIDVYRPGVIPIDSKTKDIALVYRNFKYKNDTLQHYYKTDNVLKKIKNDPPMLDSLMAVESMNQLAAKLKESNPGLEIHIFPGIFKPHYGAKMPSLNFDVIKRIGAESETNFVISLESQSSLYAEYAAGQGEPRPREVVTANVWAVYSIEKEKIIDRKTLIDTVFWNALDDAGKVQKNIKLPTRLQALKTAAQMAGESYSKRFVPSWQSVTRVYSVPSNSDFESAEKYLKKGDWENAIMLWKRYIGSKNEKLSVSAAFNLALGYELKDDIDTAIQWLNASKQIATKMNSSEDLKRIDPYMAILLQRKRDIERLNNE